MLVRRLLLSIALALPATLAPAAAGWAAEGFSLYVDSEGTISLPADFRSWAYLGTWSIAGEEGAAGFHVVYTQPETVAAYRRTGRFPDGAVLVKELFETETGDLTTGQVSWARETSGWFVMVKDSAGRFPGHPLWGDGWGWALFQAEDPKTTVTENYRDDCLGCHVPAQGNDWIYVEGYPVLEK